MSLNDVKHEKLRCFLRDFTCSVTVSCCNHKTVQHWPVCQRWLGWAGITSAARTAAFNPLQEDKTSSTLLTAHCSKSVYFVKLRKGSGKGKVEKVTERSLNVTKRS